jgi:hypothetical protein
MDEPVFPYSITLPPVEGSAVLWKLSVQGQAARMVPLVEEGVTKMMTLCEDGTACAAWVLPDGSMRMEANRPFFIDEQAREVRLLEDTAS